MNLVEDLKNVPVSLVSLLLKKMGLPSSFRNREKMLLKIRTLLQDGKLSYDDFMKEIRMSEECGSKIIHLRDILDFNDLKADDKVLEILNKLPKSRGKELTTIKLPDEPTLNYKIFDDKEIRIKFSEKQTKFSQDIDELRLIPEDVTNVIVFSVNRKNGHAKIYFDTPHILHSHRNENERPTDSQYFNYYLKLFEDLFGENHSVNLNSGLNALLRMKPPTCIVRINTDINNFNTEARLKNRNLLKDLDFVARVNDESRDKINDYSALTFLRQVSDGNLTAHVNVHIHPFEGILKIPAKRLSSEVDYVISAIRQI